MEFLTKEELRKMFLFSAKKIEENREEINRINVFPVPDQDTGNNIAKTLEGIKEAIEIQKFNNLKEISEAALDGALTAAQGNAGVIYTGFLAGFLPLMDEDSASIKKISQGFEQGAERAKKSIQNPKEGTILDVIQAASQRIKKESEKESDIIKVFKIAAEDAKEALLATREKMEIFKKANVVDAGGLAFLIIMESYIEALEPSFIKAEEVKEEKASEKVRRFVQTLSNRYEVVSLIQNPELKEDAFRQKLSKLGNCLDIVQVKDKTKVHIHTDYPEEVKQIIRESGRILSMREEDMAREVVGQESVRKVSIGIVTEDIATLLPKIVERYQVEIIHPILDWPDLEKIPGENIYQKIREIWKTEMKVLPKTSQAAPKSYFEAYKKQLEKFDKVLCLTITSKLSGSYNSAIQAKEMLAESERGKVYVLDSLTAAAGQGLLTLRAIELIQEQREMAEVVQELKKIIPQIRTYIIFEDPKGVESIGRISKGQANWVRRMKKLNIHPIMELKNGIIGKGGIILAKNEAEAISKKVFKAIKKEKKTDKKIRAIINHADSLEEAEKVKKMLKEIKIEIPFISEGPPILCAVTGPGTLIVSWLSL